METTVLLKKSNRKGPSILFDLQGSIYRLGPIFFSVVFLSLSTYILRTGTLQDSNFIYFIFTGFAFILGLFNYFSIKIKINLELFERRFEIYQNCLEAIGDVVREGGIEPLRAMGLLKGINAHKSRLLFSNDVFNHLDNIYKGMVRLHTIKTMLNGNTSDKKPREELSQEYADLLKEISDAGVTLPDVFEKYLSFRDIY